MRTASMLAAVLVVLSVVGCISNRDASDAPLGSMRAKPTHELERPFSSSSPWNQRVDRRATLDPRSPALVRELKRQVAAAPPWINTTEYTAPVYSVPPNQRRVRVELETDYPDLQRAFDSVPVPPDARPSAGSDRQLVVWQPATDTMWEFWLMRRESGAWRARWGGRMDHVSRDDGVFPAPFGSTATGLPLVAGMIQPTELERGEIDHALAFAVIDARAERFVPPATRTDGQSTRRDAIPEGARFRLDPRLDLNRLGLARPLLTLATAVQRYGMILRDKAGAVVFYAEAPHVGAPNPYPRLLDGQYPDRLLERFPWRHLQAILPVPNTSGGR